MSGAPSGGDPGGLGAGAATVVAADGGVHDDGGAGDGSTARGDGGAAHGEPCCAAHGSVGCSDPAIEKCVCAQDPRCCSEKWDDVCVALVGGLGCGSCKADCCTASSVPGCLEPAVEACVCAKSPDCCNVAWDDFCVLLVASTAGGGACGACP
jgi:hypothetical protein